MKKGDLFKLIGVSFCLVVLTLFITQNITNAAKVCRLEETRVVRISGSSEGEAFLKVEPRNLDVIAGDCVVWVNWSKGPEIKVVFKEGKVCHDVTRPRAAFTMDAKNCYVTNYIPYGGTSSLTFKEKGVFNYEVIDAEGKAIKCKLTVTEPPK